jgi:hypothetical protein
MPLPFTRAHYDRWQECDVLHAPLAFDELSNPDKFGTLSNAVVDGLSAPQIVDVVHAAALRMPHRRWEDCLQVYPPRGGPAN